MYDMYGIWIDFHVCTLRKIWYIHFWIHWPKYIFGEHRQGYHKNVCIYIYSLKWVLLWKSNSNTIYVYIYADYHTILVIFSLLLDTWFCVHELTLLYIEKYETFIYIVWTISKFYDTYLAYMYLYFSCKVAEWFLKAYLSICTVHIYNREGEFCQKIWELCPIVGSAGGDYFVWGLSRKGGGYTLQILAFFEKNYLHKEGKLGYRIPMESIDTLDEHSNQDFIKGFAEEEK